MKNWIIFFFLLISANAAHSQEKSDSLPYELYKERVVLFSDLGFNSAPFSIKDDFNGGETTLRFKHNLRLAMGLGVMYKWFALRVGFGLPGELRSKSRFGKSQFRDIGLRFSIKQTFWSLDARNYTGFAIVDANEWNDTLNDLNPNLIRPNTRVNSFSVNSWFFSNKEFKMPAVMGKVGHYKKGVGTWYLKGTLNYFSISNANSPIIPYELIDSTQSKSLSKSISAVDLGVVPGYAYVGRVNNWQLSAFVGFGGVTQVKSHTFGETTRGFLGLAPRLDVRFIAGYSKPNYFVWLTTDFDVKSIRFRELKYNQVYYRLKVIGGIRLKRKEKKSDKV